MRGVKALDEVALLRVVQQIEQSVVIGGGLCIFGPVHDLEPHVHDLVAPVVIQGQGFVLEESGDARDAQGEPDDEGVVDAMGAQRICDVIQPCAVVDLEGLGGKVAEIHLEVVHRARSGLERQGQQAAKGGAVDHVCAAVERVLKLLHPLDSAHVFPGVFQRAVAGGHERQVLERGRAGYGGDGRACTNLEAGQLGRHESVAWVRSQHGQPFVLREPLQERHLQRDRLPLRGLLCVGVAFAAKDLDLNELLSQVEQRIGVAAVQVALLRTPIAAVKGDC